MRQRQVGEPPALQSTPPALIRNMSLQRRKLQRETSNLAGREEKHERRKEKAGLVGMRGQVPHILFLFHSLPLLLPPTPGDREQTGLTGVGGRGRSWGTGKGQRPMPTCPPCPLWDWSLFIPPTKGDERGLALSYPQGVSVCVSVRVRVYTRKGESQSLTCLHLSPRPAAHSPKPPSGGWRTRTAVPEGRGNGWQVDRLSTYWTSQGGRGRGAGILS